MSLASERCCTKSHKHPCAPVSETRNLFDYSVARAAISEKRARACLVHGFVAIAPREMYLTGKKLQSGNLL